MSIPSLSLGGHDHYTPELRDRLLEKLRAAPFDQTAYHMLTPARLRALAEIEATDATVASLYMQLGPDRRLGGAWRTFFSSLCELERIEHALDAELPALGRGVAFFSSQK